MLVTLGLVVVAVAVAAGALVVPLVSNRRLRDTRQPTDAERERIADFREWGDLDVERAYVIETVGEASIDVSVYGPPGLQALFVTDYVLDELDEGTAGALVAAEAGRVATYYGVFRAVSVGIVIALLATIFAVPLPFDLGLLAMGLFALAAFAVGRRLQYAADARAADRVGADALADAFEHVADLRGAEPETGTWRTLFEIQPPLGDRIERLREGR